MRRATILSIFLVGLLAVGLGATGDCPGNVVPTDGGDGDNGDGADGTDGGDGAQSECLTDAVGILTVLWTPVTGTGGSLVGMPNAVFENQRLAPWYFVTAPTDRVWAYAGKEDERVTDDAGDGPYLDAGTPLLVKGAPEGNIQLDRQTDNTYMLNFLTIAPRTFNQCKMFEWDVPGGADVNAFTKEMQIPEPLTVSSPTLGSVTLDRTTPLQVTWDVPQTCHGAHIIFFIVAEAGDVYGFVEGDLVDDGSATIGVDKLSVLPSDDVAIAMFRAYYGQVTLTKPVGMKVYFTSQIIATAN